MSDTAACTYSPKPHADENRIGAESSLLVALIRNDEQALIPLDAVFVVRVTNTAANPKRDHPAEPVLLLPDPKG